MPGTEIKLENRVSENNNIIVICTFCGITVNRLNGFENEKEIKLSHIGLISWFNQYPVLIQQHSTFITATRHSCLPK